MSYSITYSGHSASLGDVFCVKAKSLLKADKIMSSEGFKMLSAEDLAVARMEIGANRLISTLPSAVSEGFFFQRDEANPAYLIRNPPVIETLRRHNKTVVNINVGIVNYNGAVIKDPYAFLDGIDAKDKLAVPGGVSTIRFEELGDSEAGNWLFGRHASDYGKFLKDNKEEHGSGRFLIWARDYYFGSFIMDKPVATQMYMTGLSIPGVGEVHNIEDKIRAFCAREKPSLMSRLILPKRLGAGI